MNEYTPLWVLLTIGLLAGIYAKLLSHRRFRMKNGELRLFNCVHFKAESLEVDADEPEKENTPLPPSDGKNANNTVISGQEATVTTQGIAPETNRQASG